MKDGWLMGWMDERMKDGWIVGRDVWVDVE